MSSTAHTGHAHGKNCAVGTGSLVCGPVLVDFLLNTVNYKQTCSCNSFF